MPIPYETSGNSCNKEVLSELVHGMQNNLSENDYVSVIRSGLERVGISSFSYVHLGCSPREAKEATIIGNYPSEWVHNYKEISLHKIDPVIAMSACSPKPFFWDEMFSVDDSGIFNMSSSYGIERGFSIPMHEPGYAFGSMHFSTKKEDQEFVGAIGRNYSFILSLSFVAHHYRPILEGFESNNSLTKREAECLQWVAAGKTYSEIAMILGISERTVKFHAKSLMVKLDSVNIKQAMSQAIRMGWI
ncbi:autoinducer binding domain-containing protein [Halomonas salifodinae]|uniref:Autoinducer binding domain-containing protein n=2 Tax=Halomonas salifodinae TaxID=438745 RepID=A0ABW2EU76_9GAMM